jgi:hypothetical protein
LFAYLIAFLKLIQLAKGGRFYYIAFAVVGIIADGNINMLQSQLIIAALHINLGYVKIAAILPGFAPGGFVKVL